MEANAATASPAILSPVLAPSGSITPAITNREIRLVTTASQNSVERIPRLTCFGFAVAFAVVFFAINLGIILLGASEIVSGQSEKAKQASADKAYPKAQEK